jgi:hypothetical protein
MVKGFVTKRFGTWELRALNRSEGAKLTRERQMSKSSKWARAANEREQQMSQSSKWARAANEREQQMSESSKWAQECQQGIEKRQMMPSYFLQLLDILFPLVRSLTAGCWLLLTEQNLSCGSSSLNLARQRFRDGHASLLSSQIVSAAQ